MMKSGEVVPNSDQKSGKLVKMAAISRGLARRWFGPRNDNCVPVRVRPYVRRSLLDNQHLLRNDLDPHLDHAVKNEAVKDGVPARLNDARAALTCALEALEKVTDPPRDQGTAREMLEDLLRDHLPLAQRTGYPHKTKVLQQVMGLIDFHHACALKSSDDLLSEKQHRNDLAPDPALDALREHLVAARELATKVKTVL